jgi:hypothetical protein
VLVLTASDHASSRAADTLAESGVSVAGLASATRGDITVVVVDSVAALPEGARARLGQLEGLLSMRCVAGSNRLRQGYGESAEASAAAEDPAS